MHTGLETPAYVYPLKESWKHQKGLRDTGPSLLRITAGAEGWPAFYQLSEMALSEWEEYKSLNHCAMNEKELKAWSSTADRERNAALPKGRESVNI